jgi:hypothetical protein
MMLSQMISELFTTLNDLSLTRPTHKAQNKKIEREALKLLSLLFPGIVMRPANNQ